LLFETFLSSIPRDKILASASISSLWPRLTSLAINSLFRDVNTTQWYCSWTDATMGSVSGVSVSTTLGGHSL